MKYEIKERIEMINRGEVPEGYKKTKVGIIPEDWEETRLDKLSKITMGQSPSSANYNENGIGLPLIQGNADIKDRYTSPRLFTSEITKTCEVDDIIMSVRAPVGEIAKSVHKACIGRGVCSIRPVDNNYYLYHYLINNERLWTRYSQGSTFESVNSNDIKKFRIVSPKSKKEQQKIAQILSTWDEAIELKEKLKEEKKEQKKGLMQNLLTGKVRLPGFGGEWGIKPIGDLLVESKTVAQNPDINKRITVKLNLKGVEKREVTAAEKEGATTHYVRKEGQFIYGKQNLHKGAFGIVPNHLDNYQSSSDIPSFDFNKNVNGIWFYYYFSRQDFYKRLENISTGTGSKRIHPKDLYKVKIKLPSLSEQKAIANILSTADKEIELLEKEVELLKLQKKGLMQLLLTGIVRVEC